TTDGFRGAGPLLHSSDSTCSAPVFFSSCGDSHPAVVAFGPAAGLDHAIFHRIVAVDLPSKELTIKYLEFVSLSAHDFEMNNSCSHRYPFPGSLGCVGAALTNT